MRILAILLTIELILALSMVVMDMIKWGDVSRMAEVYVTVHRIFKIFGMMLLAVFTIYMSVYLIGGIIMLFD